ncbi:MAG: ABC transporter ATP-binding protein [Planctomycetaceae bacterium]
MTVLRTEGLTKVYRNGALGIADLDLEVRAGEVLAFVGPNGAGKTTTIRLLLDFLRPTRGTASVLGLDSRKDSLAVRRRIGFLPGDLALYGSLTGEETLELFARLRGERKPALREELLGWLAIPPEMLRRKVGTLSTGTRQKLGLLVALQHNPSLAILDEPTTGLDPLVRRHFHDAIRRWRTQAHTLFLSSHDIAEVELLCDRVCIVKSGRLAALDTVAGLRAAAPQAASLEEAILSHYARP